MEWQIFEEKFFSKWKKFAKSSFFSHFPRLRDTIDKKSSSKNDPNFWEEEKCFGKKFFCQERKILPGDLLAWPRLGLGLGFERLGAIKSCNIMYEGIHFAWYHKNYVQEKRRVRVSAWVLVHVQRWVWVCVWVCVCVSAWTLVLCECLLVRTDGFVCECAWVYVCLYVCMFVWVYACVC